MTDIVELLRDRAASYDDRAGSLELEAASEIDRLRMALSKIAAIEDSYTSGDWDEIEEARRIAKEAIVQ